MCSKTNALGVKTIITSPKFDYLWEELSQKLDISRADVRMETFPDWTPNLYIEKDDVKNKIATVLLDFSDIKDLFINYALLQWLVDYKVEALNIIMPYFPVWTMERVWKPWEVATAHTLANIISNLPSGKWWRKNNLHILDLHAEVEEFLFDAKNINIETYSAFELLKEEIQWKTIIFPDAGAAKRFENSFPNNPKVICSKKRVWGERIIEILEWEIDWENWIIMDDLIQTWGTIIQTAKALKKLWAKNIEAFATHWVFPNNSHINMAKNLDKLITTDSIPENVNRAQNIENMEIVWIKKLIEKIILEN